MNLDKISNHRIKVPAQLADYFVEKYPSIKSDTVFAKYKEFLGFLTAAYCEDLIRRRKQHDDTFTLKVKQLGDDLGNVKVAGKQYVLLSIFQDAAKHYHIEDYGTKGESYSRVYLTGLGARQVENMLKVIHSGGAIKDLLPGWFAKCESDIDQIILDMSKRLEQTAHLHEMNEYPPRVCSYEAVTKRYPDIAIEDYAHLCYNPRLRHFGDLLERGRVFATNTPINVDALTTFRDILVDELRDDDLSSPLRRRKNADLIVTKLILESTVTCNGEHHLPQSYKISDSGRMYYTGLNLQNCSRHVREAALAGFHQYDMVCAAISLMMAECHRIDTITWPINNPGIKRSFQTGHETVDELYTQTIALLTDRTTFRRNLASNMSRRCKETVTVAEVKEAIQAISFGARPVVASWVSVSEEEEPSDDNDDQNTEIKYEQTALHRIFASKAKGEAFLYFAGGLIREIKAIFKIVTDYYMNIPDHCVYGYSLPKKAEGEKPYTKSQISAHVYQSMESFVMQSVIANCLHLDITSKGNFVPRSPILVLHDGFVTRRYYPEQGMKESIFMSSVSQWSDVSRDDHLLASDATMLTDWAYFTVEHTQLGKQYLREEQIINPAQEAEKCHMMELAAWRKQNEEDEILAQNYESSFVIMCGKSEREKKQEIYDAVASNLRLNYEGISEEEIFHLVGDIMSPEPTGNKELDLLNSLMEGNKRDFGQE